MADGAERRYAYGFDFDVMHPFMIRSFAPFFRAGGMLELGCFKGDFTRRLLTHFKEVTCVEASDAALAEAREKLGEAATFVHSTFEEAVLPRRYENIVLSHVLEHLDDPVGILRRINREWLSDGGRLFLVCPNGNAPSRQIAVKMGLISHNSAVTPAEAEHGHRRTYTLDTLERDAAAAGLQVVHRTGIFFKALANFQWDRLLQTDIVSAEYLEGCYQLGQQYPDLCASIFLLCERASRSSPGHEPGQPSLNVRPLVRQDGEAHGVAGGVVGRQPVSAKNAFEFATDAFDRRGRTLVASVGMEADAECPPFLESVRQHQQLGLGVGGRADCRAGQPGVADLAAVDGTTAVTRMALRPRPPFQVPEAGRADDGAVADPHDGERHRAAGFAPGYCGVDDCDVSRSPCGTGLHW